VQSSHAYKHYKPVGKPAGKVVMEFAEKPKNLSLRGQVYRPRNLLFLDVDPLI
jgi:hypothetical protein